MANYRQGKVTPQLFEAVKICLSSGNSITQTAQFMKLSQDVVSAIQNSETLMEYKAIMYERSQRNRKAVAAVKAKEKQEEQPLQNDKQKGGTLSANYQMNRVCELLKAQNETLVLISNKLAYILEQLT